MPSENSNQETVFPKSQFDLIKVLATIGAILSVVIIFTALVWYFVAGRFDSSALDDNNVKISTPSANKFTNSTIIKSFSFTTSAGEKKNFLIVSETGTTDEAFITDEINSKNSDIKLSGSGKETFTGCSAIDIEGLKACDQGFSLYPSPGPGIKYLVLERSFGDGSSIWLYDEKGKLISFNVAGNTFDLVKNYITTDCPCASTFDSWKNSDEFYVNIGGNQVLVDAKTGQAISFTKK